MTTTRKAGSIERAVQAPLDYVAGITGLLAAAVHFLHREDIDPGAVADALVRDLPAGERRDLAALSRALDKRLTSHGAKDDRR